MHLHDKGDARSSNAFLLTLVAYFILQILIRTSQGGTLALDEAEQVFYSQRLLLGYDGQPPLYNWLQWVAFKLFGVGPLGLSALKNVLLLMLFVCMYQLAKPFVGTLGAVSVSSSLVLFSPIGWESQIDRTHSILATTLAALSLQAYFAVLRQPSGFRRALLGLFIALGMQSKYNFAVFGAGLFVASIAVREHRQVFWNRGVWITVLVAILCLLPHGLWFAGNIELATEDTLRKMGAGQEHAGSYGQNVASGLGRLAFGIVGFMSPFWILFALASRPYWKHIRFQSGAPSSRFFLFLYTGALAGLIVLAFGGHLANVRGRWLQPLLFSLPLALVVMFPATATPLVLRRMICISGVVAACMLAALALRPYARPALGKPLRMHQPYPELAAELVRRFPDARALATQDRHTAGNLRFQQTLFPTVLIDDVLARPWGIEGKILFLVQSGTHGNWRRRLGDALPKADILEQGQIVARSVERGEQTLQFDYVLVRAQRQPEPSDY
jgi:4-amino-4-deoxy-L-arabinose transferase-like glycosyltransferase